MSNKIQCKKCFDIIESKYRHDFVECKCGSVFVDGGDDYCHVGYPANSNIEDWIEFDENKFVCQECGAEFDSCGSFICPECNKLVCCQCLCYDADLKEAKCLECWGE